MTELNDALSAAFDEHNNEPEASPAPVESAPVESAPSEPTPVEAQKPESDTSTQPKDGRDTRGRFVPKAAQKAPKLSTTSAQQTLAPLGETPPLAEGSAPAEAPAQVVEAVKAPQGWKPAAREKWAAVPAEVQAEVMRRERETSVALNESAEARKHYDAFRRTVAPFEGMIRAEGGEPLSAIASLLQTGAALRTAPGHHKAQMLAQLIKTYNVPIDALDAALAGEAPQQRHNPVDPGQLAAQIKADLMRDMQQGRQRIADQQAVQTVEQFAQKAEFFDDVRHDVADLMEMAARRKVQLSLEDAYNRACKAHPEISGVLAQREAAKAANANNASTQRARAASASVKSQPAVSNGSGPNDLRSALESSIDRLSGR